MIRDPASAPTNTPAATGPAMNGSICPRANHTAAPAAAVTPIMKLLVAVETLMGNPIARSIAGTFRIPEPMPKSPLNTPATSISPSAGNVRVTWYATSRPSAWS